MAEEDLREAFATDVVLLKYVGINPVIVHGGGPEITDYMNRLGLEVEFVQGLRVSDEQTVEVAKMVLIGKLNKDIVLRLNRHGQSAVGLCGDDGSLFEVAKQLVPDASGRGARPRLRRHDRARRRRRAQPHRRGLHPGRGVGRGGRARATPTTSTPTRRPARSPPRSARTR